MGQKTQGYRVQNAIEMLNRFSILAAKHDEFPPLSQKILVNSPPADQADPSDQTDLSDQNKIQSSKEQRDKEKQLDPLPDRTALLATCDVLLLKLRRLRAQK